MVFLNSAKPIFQAKVSGGLFLGKLPPTVGFCGCVVVINGDKPTSLFQLRSFFGASKIPLLSREIQMGPTKKTQWRLHTTVATQPEATTLLQQFIKKKTLLCVSMMERSALIHTKFFKIKK